MRTQGKITHWNDEKGYGFITPDSGAKQVFVHVRAFGNREARPAVGQLVSFSLSTDKQGRPCAVRVTRAGEKPVGKRKQMRRSWPIGRVVLIIVVVAIAGSVTYSRYQSHQSGVVASLKAPSSSQSKPLRAAPSGFHCDGRTHCSQMTSCAEAKYFIRNCPNTKMDGDHDGVPCESQWCNY